MYKLNDVFYLDDEYAKRAKFCDENMYTIAEIEADDKGRRFKIVERPKPTQKDKALQEIDDIKQWFDVDYARLEQKYRRLYTLKLYCNDGSYPYDKLIDLYNEAEYKRARIQQLERVISNEMV